MLNQARLKVLKAREDHIQTVLTEARQSLVTIARDQHKYPKILEGLIAQVCFALLDTWIANVHILEITSRLFLAMGNKI
jgi:V-type H+-transporting ATPase subunit E